MRHFDTDDAATTRHAHCSAWAARQRHGDGVKDEKGTRSAAADRLEADSRCSQALLVLDPEARQAVLS